MSEHVKQSQFWISESGALITARKNHGRYVVCSCGAELWCGPDFDYQVPQPARLEELRDREMSRTPEEDTEFDVLWKDWNAKQQARFEESYVDAHRRMRLAIDRHAGPRKQE